MHAELGRKRQIVYVSALVELENDLHVENYFM